MDFCLLVVFVCQALAEALQHNRTITTLGLQYNNIRAADLEAQFGEFSWTWPASHPGMRGRCRGSQAALHARGGLLELGLWRAVDWLRSSNRRGFFAFSDRLSSPPLQLFGQAEAYLLTGEFLLRCMILGLGAFLLCSSSSSGRSRKGSGLRKFVSSTMSFAALFRLETVLAIPGSDEERHPNAGDVAGC